MHSYIQNKGYTHLIIIKHDIRNKNTNTKCQTKSSKNKKKKQNKPFTDFLDKKRFSVKTRCADTKNTVYNINTFHVTNLQYHILLSTKQ